MYKGFQIEIRVCLFFFHSTALLWQLCPSHPSPRSSQSGTDLALWKVLGALYLQEIQPALNWENWSGGEWGLFPHSCLLVPSGSVWGSVDNSTQTLESQGTRWRMQGQLGVCWSPWATDAGGVSSSLSVPECPQSVAPRAWSWRLVPWSPHSLFSLIPSHVPRLTFGFSSTPKGKL